MTDNDNKTQPSSKQLVFISYAAEDNLVAQIIEEKLRAAKIESWRDRREIAGGDGWVQKIGEGLEKCTAVVVLLTPTSIEKSWVRKEIDIALAGEKRIIPVLYQLPVAKIPQSLIDTQATEIKRLEDIDALIERDLGGSRETQKGEPGDAQVPDTSTRTGYSTDTSSNTQQRAALLEQMTVEQKECLVLICKADRWMEAQEIAEYLGVPVPEARYHLDRLTELKLSNDFLVVSEWESYEIQKPGRQLVYENLKEEFSYVPIPPSPPSSNSIIPINRRDSPFF